VGDDLADVDCLVSGFPIGVDGDHVSLHLVTLLLRSVIVTDDLGTRHALVVRPDEEFAPLSVDCHLMGYFLGR
jgi:hypothetical protein